MKRAIRFWIFKVWVDAPQPDYCGDDTPPHGVCTLLGHYRDPYEWYKFESAKKKFQANRELLDEADYRRQHYFKGIFNSDSYAKYSLAKLLLIFYSNSNSVG